MSLLATYDGLCWVAGFVVLSAVQRVIGDVDRTSIVHSACAGLLCAAALLVIGWTLKVHQGRAKLGSFDEVVLLVAVVALVGLGENVVNIVLGVRINGAVAAMAPFAALTLMIWARGAYRVWSDQAPSSSRSTNKIPVVVIGAGEAGHQLVVSMLREPSSRWSPVAIVDDDPLKRHRRIRGIQVMGTTDKLVEIAARTHASTVVIAIPSAPSGLIRRLTSLAKAADIDVKVLPSPVELLVPTQVEISDIRDIDVTDLLGRRVVDTDIAAIAGYLSDKRVLVTGAGGSIGSELCRQLAKLGPAELIMLDRDESALHAVELSIHGTALLDTDATVLCDIRDTQFVVELFERRRPHVVFHAAALKHLPLLERAPGEAIKTNVWGTLTMLEASAACGVERFVNISTDKAANPCSVLGYSKRLAEGLTASVAKAAAGTYLSVRFGNVLGSRGSVLTTFAAQVATGGPVTVTDPHVTRYFMTIPEAVQLVIQAAVIGRDGEALVLDMGQPVSIDSVARQVIELSGKDVDVIYTGLRPGEKMDEDLFGEGEQDERPAHPLISHTPVPAYGAHEAIELDPWSGTEETTKLLERACADMRSRMSKPVDA
ncbi:MAG: pglF [Marmoricola sp.]|nr:pglF [Marmoricola sp.]